MRRASTAGIVEVGVGVRGMKILISSKLPEHASKHRASPSKLVHGRAQSTPSRNQPARLSTLYHPTPSTCSVAAQQDSPIRKSLGRLMTRVDFLMPAETPPASCRDIPPTIFSTRTPKVVALQRLSRGNRARKTLIYNDFGAFRPVWPDLLPCAATLPQLRQMTPLDSKPANTASKLFQQTTESRSN